ncbi:hypothetical protein AAHN97_22735 [Chitinophaga niabensis]|uniref:hypothetical protein n=1 Tax=Chitinophaga niabensis TaxID=536979 RepID=UPI0031BA2440
MKNLKLSFAILVAVGAVALTLSTNARSIFEACSQTVTITNPNPDVVFSQGAAFADVNQYQGRTDAVLSGAAYDTEDCLGTPEQFCCATKASGSGVVLIYRQNP